MNVDDDTPGNAEWYSIWDMTQINAKPHDTLHLCYPDPVDMYHQGFARTVIPICKFNHPTDINRTGAVRKRLEKSENVCKRCSEITELSAREALASGESVLAIGRLIMEQYRTRFPAYNDLPRQPAKLR